MTLTLQGAEHTKHAGDSKLLFSMEKKQGGVEGTESIARLI